MKDNTTPDALGSKSSRFSNENGITSCGITSNITANQEPQDDEIVREIAEAIFKTHEPRSASRFQFGKSNTSHRQEAFEGVMMDSVKASYRASQIIEWYGRNPEAIKALLEGKAAVVPLPFPGSITQYPNGKIMEAQSYLEIIALNRLDKPKEAV